MLRLSNSSSFPERLSSRCEVEKGHSDYLLSHLIDYPIVNDRISHYSPFIAREDNQDDTQVGDPSIHQPIQPPSTVESETEDELNDVPLDSVITLFQGFRATHPTDTILLPFISHAIEETVEIKHSIPNPSFIYNKLLQRRESLAAQMNAIDNEKVLIHYEYNARILISKRCQH